MRTAGQGVDADTNRQPRPATAPANRTKAAPPAAAAPRYRRRTRALPRSSTMQRAPLLPADRAAQVFPPRPLPLPARPRGGALEPHGCPVRPLAAAPEPVASEPALGLRRGGDRAFLRPGAGAVADAHSASACRAAQEEPAGGAPDDALHQPVHHRAALSARLCIRESPAAW